MLLRITTPGGKVLQLDAQQVVVLTDLGQPVACSAEAEGQLIVHCDATKADWPEFIRQHGVMPVPHVRLR